MEYQDEITQGVSDLIAERVEAQVKRLYAENAALTAALEDVMAENMTLYRKLRNVRKNMLRILDAATEAGTLAMRTFGTANGEDEDD